MIKYYVCTRSFGEMIKIHNGLHVSLASALKNYIVIISVSTANAPKMEYYSLAQLWPEEFKNKKMEKT